MSTPLSRNRTRSDFSQKLIYGFVHDFSAPVRHMINFSRMLEESPTTNFGEEDKELVQLLQSSGERAQSMLESVSQLMRLAVFNTRLESIDVKKLFYQIVEQSRCRSPTNEVSLIVGEDWPNVFGYHAQWSRLLQSFIDNAILYQPKTVDQLLSIRATCEADGTSTRLTIEDNGIGVDAGQFSSITTPFKRLHNPKDYDGIGMGLTYCAYIAELNNASLHFDKSELGGLKVTYTEPIRSY